MLKLLTITHSVFLQYAYSHVSRFHKWRITYLYPYPYHVSCDLGWAIGPTPYTLCALTGLNPAGSPGSMQARARASGQGG